MIKKLLYIAAVPIALLLVLAGCGSQPEDFETFYKRFTTDEDFQLSRIEFPLAGCETDNDTTIFWNSPEDWAFLSEPSADLDTTIFRIEREVTATYAMVKVYLEDSGFGSTEEYELVKGKWYLRSYDSMSN